MPQGIGRHARSAGGSALRGTVCLGRSTAATRSSRIPPGLPALVVGCDTLHRVASGVLSFVHGGSPVRTSLGLLAALALIALPLSAQTSGLRDPLLDRLIGDWLLEGTIGGDQVTHAVTFEWVLGHHYVRFHEVARERDSTGAPAYEAIVFIGWDQSSERYACLWLDSTGGEGLSAPAIGHAVASGDTIPFVFHFPDGSPFYTTFSYGRSTDTWNWSMDVEGGGTRQPFARVTLSRK